MTQKDAIHAAIVLISSIKEGVDPEQDSDFNEGRYYDKVMKKLIRLSNRKKI